MAVGKREQWSSEFGFLMAAAGSAVGLGNLWKFPYMAANNGGAVFVAVYILFLLLLGIPILLSEMAVGRSTRLNALDACKKISKRWGFVGGIGIAGSFVILSYYSVVGGWVLKYLFTYITGTNIADPAAYFDGFVSSAAEPIIWHVVFMGITAVIVFFGIRGGIERASRILLPSLLVFIIILAAVSVSLDGAEAGVRYFIVPDFGHLDSAGEIGRLFLAAMGQVFFSLSLGMGTLITYGSYLDKHSNLQKNAVAIPLIDSVVAILAGFAILPAVFAFGLEPSGGAGLVFKTLPSVFVRLPVGRLLAVIFFLLVFFAALTSSISLLEVITAFLMDRFSLSRIKAALIPAVLMTLLGTAASLSFGVLGGLTIGGMGIFDLLTFLSDKILMPIGGFFMCILVGYIWGIPAAAKEITSSGRYRFPLAGVFSAVVRYVAPALIILIFISSLLSE